MTEKQLEEKCTAFARSKGIAVVKLENNKNKGIPDRMFIAEGGDVLFIEFKNPNKKGVVSQEQKFWLSFLGGKGHICDNFADFVLKISNLFAHEQS